MLTRHRLLSRASRYALSCALGVTLYAGLAHAGGKDFAVYTTRLGGDTETAQPYIDRFAAALETTTGWPKGATGLKGRFLPTKKEALAFIDSGKPGFGVLEPWLYFELRKAHKLEAAAEVDSADLNSPKLHVVVKDPAVKSLNDLKGKRLWTHLAESPQYLGNVVLDGKVGAPDKFFALKQTGQAMKAVRAVLRGEADAALIDDEQLEAAKKLEGGAELRDVFTSSQQPPVYVVVFGANGSAIDKASLAKAVVGFCGTPKGGETCKEMHITRFVPLNSTLYSATEKRYESTGGAKK